MCSRTSTGKLKVSEEVHKMWQQTGKVQRDMIKIMMDVDGDRDSSHKISKGSFIRTVYMDWNDVPKVAM